jgi:ketosteroid isomerase-like protein
MKVLILIIFGLILQMAATAKPDSVSEDIKVVTALDSEYQLAVLRNDAATMDRILADDFVLVLGNGTVYKKADLINAARDKTIIYERQEDSNRTVRVFGDTAIVTALL